MNCTNKENNTGELTFYQCKNCLSFLASTAKWDRHISKCRSKIVIHGNGTPINGSMVGFRLKTFTEPTVLIQRLVIRNLDKGRDHPSSSEPKKRGRKLGSARSKLENLRGKLGVATNERVLEEGWTNFRQSFIKAKNKVHDICTKLKEANPSGDGVEISNSSRTCLYKKKIKKYAKVSKDLSKKQGLDNSQKVKRGRGRPPKELNIKVLTGGRSNPNTKKYLETKEKTVVKAKRGSYKKAKTNKIQEFTYPCHLCPGKFGGKNGFNKHIKSVHFGNRRLMSCVVCGRIFNKRDSLNSHLSAHAQAEIKEEKFKLFEPWSDVIKERAFQKACKACLLSHPTHYSYLNHFRREHADPPETYRVSCKFQKCVEQFDSIRNLLQHAKTAHTREFYGKLTWLRLTKGFYTGVQVYPRDANGKYIWKKDRISEEPKPNSSSVCKKKTVRRRWKERSPHAKKRISSFTPKNLELQTVEKKDDNVGREPGTSDSTVPTYEVLIKLEDVDIVEEKKEEGQGLGLNHNFPVGKTEQEQPEGLFE